MHGSLTAAAAPSYLRAPYLFEASESKPSDPHGQSPFLLVQRLLTAPEEPSCQDWPICTCTWLSVGTVRPPICSVTSDTSTLYCMPALQPYSTPATSSHIFCKSARRSRAAVCSVAESTVLAH